jgi:hypothetical protein
VLQWRKTRREEPVLAPREERLILEKAYLPEHVVSLMTSVSGGEPFLFDDFVSYARDNWAILVGYPLTEALSDPLLERAIARILKELKPEYLWLMAPEIPAAFIQKDLEQERDVYFTISLDGYHVKERLKRVATGASSLVTVERNKTMSSEHRKLIKEFLTGGGLTPRVRELFLAMPEYVNHCKTAFVLEARDMKGRLVAFYVLELGASTFLAYVVGCRSRRDYVPHVSDLLFLTMTELAREENKGSINLGLGVNQGIRRFKEKWGGRPSFPYHFCEYRTGFTGQRDFMRALESKL